MPTASTTTRYSGETLVPLPPPLPPPPPNFFQAMVDVPNAAEARVIAAAHTAAAAAAAAVLAKALEPGSSNGGGEGAVIRRHVICRPFPPLTYQVLDEVMSSNAPAQSGNNVAQDNSEGEEKSSPPTKSRQSRKSPTRSASRRRGKKQDAGGNVAREGSAKRTKSSGSGKKGSGKTGSSGGGPDKISLRIGVNDALATAETPEQSPKKSPCRSVSAPKGSLVAKAARSSPRPDGSPPQIDSLSGSAGATKKSPFDEFLDRPWSDGFKSGPNKRGHSLRFDKQAGRIRCVACSKSYVMRHEHNIEKHLGEWNHLTKLRLYIEKKNVARATAEAKKLERNRYRKRKREDDVVPSAATNTKRSRKPPQRLTVGEDGGFVEENLGEDGEISSGNDDCVGTEASEGSRLARRGVAPTPRNRRRLPMSATFTVPPKASAKATEQAAATTDDSPRQQLHLTEKDAIKGSASSIDVESNKVEDSGNLKDGGVGTQNEEEGGSEGDDVDLELEPLPEPLQEPPPKRRPRPRPTEDERDEDYNPSSDGDSDEEDVPKKKKVPPPEEKKKTGLNKPRGPRRSFSERMAELRTFEEVNGHLRVPNKGHTLSSFARYMRQLWRTSCKPGGTDILSDEDKAKLKELKEVKFSFDPIFDERIEQLLEYKRTHGGNMEVPGSYPVIGPWAYNLRIDYGRMRRGERTKSLDLHRMQRLTDIGFVFRHRKSEQKSFSEWMKLLKAFKEKHGHTKVPQKQKQLAQWVYRMQLYYRRRKQAEAEGEESTVDPKLYRWLTPEKIKELDDIGFYWKADYETPKKLTTEKWSWDRYVEEFKAYKAAYGHPYVSAVDPHYRKLGIWVAHQRQRYKFMKQGIDEPDKDPPLTAEQALTLTEAGFAWDASHIRRTPKSSVELENVPVCEEGVEIDENISGEEQG